MVVAPVILGGDLKISDQNNLGGLGQKIKFGEGGPKILGGGLMNIVGEGGHTPHFLDQLLPFF